MSRVILTPLDPPPVRQVKLRCLADDLAVYILKVSDLVVPIIEFDELAAAP